MSEKFVTEVQIEDDRGNVTTIEVVTEMSSEQAARIASRLYDPYKISHAEAVRIAEKTVAATTSAE